MYKAVEHLNIYLRLNQEEILVGAVASQKGTIFFQYDPDFLRRSIDLSPLQLKFSEHVQHSFPEAFFGLPGLIFDSLPDGWGLLLMNRHFLNAGIPIESIGPLDRLAYIGDRGIGALVYRPNEKIGKVGRKEVDLPVLAKEAIRVFEGAPGEVLPQLLRLGGSPGGARPKVLIAYNEQTNHIISGVDEIPSGYSQYLIKFPAESDPPFPGETEYAYSLMAREAGLHLPETRLFPGVDDKKSFGIERFDRSGNARIHVHTLGGLIHTSHRIPSFNYEGALKVAQTLTRDRGDVLALFRQMVFNVATHNRDDHVRNFSFILHNDGTWHLSPSYDLTYSHGPGGEHSMTIAGEGKNLNLEHINRVGEEFNIRKNEKSEIVEGVMDAVKNWNKFAKKAGVPKEVSARIKSKFVMLTL